MDSLLPSLIGFLLALLLCNAGFSFGAALQNLSEKELAAALEAGDKRAGELLRQKERPGRFVSEIRKKQREERSGQCTSSWQFSLSRSGLCEIWSTSC